jgi:hypothetical protein
MNTRKFSRTMQQAFGPYCSNELHAKPAPMHPADKIIFAIGAVVLLALVALSVLRGFA